MGVKDIDFKLDNSVVITEVTWDRIFLNLRIACEHPEDLTISMARVVFSWPPLKGTGIPDDTYTHAEFLRDIPLTPSESDDNGMSFRLNMSIISGGSFLDNGRWFFIIKRPGEKKPSFPLISNEAAQTIKYLDRIFPYGRTRYAYTAKFTVLSFGTPDMVLALHSRFMIENQDWEERFKLSERRTLQGKLKTLVRKTKRRMLCWIYAFLDMIHKKDGNHILLMSESKPYLWGNLKYLDDRIKARGLDDRIKVSYSFRQAVGVNNSFKSWVKTINNISKQDIIFVDDFAPIFDFLKLSDRTKLVQVWHAGVGFKSVGYGRFGSASSPHPTYCCHRKYDLAVVGSRDLVEVYSEVFGIPEDRVLPLGMARLDNFLDEDIMETKKKAFYDDHPECIGRKLILFCPTFRGSGQRFARYDYDMLDMKRIYDFCGDEYIWAFKMHPFVLDAPPIPPEYTDRIIDLSAAHDINDLYYVTDIMVTDYSSAYYDFALLERPVLFYTYDRDHYEVVRGVHKTIRDTAPGKVCDSFDELMTALKTGDFEIEKTIRFHEENFGEYDGKAADRIIDTIILNDPS